jgi:hypothetical protein
VISAFSKALSFEKKFFVPFCTVFVLGLFFVDYLLLATLFWFKMATMEQTPLLQVSPPPYATASSPMTYFVPIPVYVPSVNYENSNFNQFVPFPYYPPTSSFVPQFNDQTYSNFMQFTAPMPEYLHPYNSGAETAVEMKSFEKSTVEAPSTQATESSTSEAPKRCTRCEKHYLPSENKSGACRYHPGKYITKYQSRLATGSF